MGRVAPWLFVLVLAAGCASGPARGRGPAEEYLVLAAALDDLCPRLEGNGKMLVSDTAETAAQLHVVPPGGDWTAEISAALGQPVSGEVVRDFVGQHTAARVVSATPITCPHLVIDAALADAVANGTKSWQDLVREWPGANGVARVSRIGYDATGTRALLYRDWTCGPNCGSRGFVYLKLDKGDWVVVAR